MATAVARKQEELFRQVFDADYGSVVRAIIDHRLIGDQDLLKVVDGLLRVFDVSKADVYELLGVSSSRVSRRPVMDVSTLDRGSAALKLFARVAAIIGDEAASDWFRRPHEHLGGKRPFDLLRTSLGQQELASMITALQDGAYL
ncbi:MAG TPA: antitoxin Xre/MbcA/ParS toxin-binding domain-containing protein [Trueperaceae bacterium]|jgi:putative toxin-antitoxin system antitoxin component (TIGR02293 family)